MVETSLSGFHTPYFWFLILHTKSSLCQSLIFINPEILTPDRTPVFPKSVVEKVEGELGNAAYWYHLADKPICESNLSDEWDDIVATLCRAE